MRRARDNPAFGSEMLFGCSCSLAAQMPARLGVELFWIGMKLLSDCGRQRSIFLPSNLAFRTTPHDRLRRTTKPQELSVTSLSSAKLTLQNYFYSILHNFLNLEIVNNFIPEEDYKLRAAMYDVEPRAPR